MPFRSLRAFVDALRKAGELHVISATVDPRLEISEITNRVVKAGGPALLFSDVQGSEFPVLTNQFGTHRRMAMALGAQSLDEVAGRASSPARLQTAVRVARWKNSPARCTSHRWPTRFRKSSATAAFMKS